RDRAHLGLGLLKFHLRPNSSNHGPETCTTQAPQGFPVRIHRIRLPYIRVVVESEVHRENADDPGRSAVKLNARADRIQRASEAGLPEAMTDQSQALPLLGLFCREGASMQGLNAEQGKQVG